MDGGLSRIKANAKASDARVLNVGGREIAVRIYKPAQRLPRNRPGSKPGVLVFFGDAAEELAVMAAQARCLVLSIEASAGVELSQLALHWVREHAVEFGADASRLGLGGEGAGAATALTMAQTASQVSILLLMAPHLDQIAARPARLPSTFVEAQATEATRGEVLGFVAALLDVGVEAELHLHAAASAGDDLVMRRALRADALKRAFQTS